MPQLSGGFKPVGTVSFSSGRQAEPFNLKKNLQGRYLHELMFAVDMTPNVTDITSVEAQSLNPHTIISGLEIRSSKYGPIHDGNAVDYAIRRDGIFGAVGEYTAEDEAADADVLDFNFRLPLFCPRSANPWATVIDTEAHAKLELIVNWGTIADIIVATAASWTAEPVLTVFARTTNFHPLGGPEMLYETGALEKMSLAAGGGDVVFDNLEMGGAGSRMTYTHFIPSVMDLHGSNGLIHDDAAITKFKIHESGPNWSGDVWGGDDMDGDQIQKDYEQVFAPTHEGIRTGIYPIDLIGPFGGTFDMGLLAEGLNRVDIKFTYGSVPTGAQIRIPWGRVQTL